MKGRMRPYLPELTIRDYNTYMRYLRGVRRQMYKSYGFYACHLLRTNGVLFAILSDSLAGRMPTCKRQRVPGTPFQRSMMCQTLGIRQAAQTEILMGWHNLHPSKFTIFLSPFNGKPEFIIAIGKLLHLDNLRLSELFPVKTLISICSS